MSASLDHSLDQLRDTLSEVNRLLLLYPASDLSARARAERVLNNRRIAQQRLSSCLAEKPAAGSTLEAVSTGWQHLPATLQLQQVEREPDLERRIMQIVYQTEQMTSQQCGAPSGDDALLLKIAQDPEAVEQP